MTDTPPDRLSINPRSPHFHQATLERGIGIRFKGLERHDVEEYSVSENWIRVALGKKVDRHGNPLTIKLPGEVEPYFQSATSDDAGPDGPTLTDGETDVAATSQTGDHGAVATDA